MAAKGLTKHQLEIISETVIKLHQNEEKKRKKEQQDKRFRNIKLLLKHYRQLKAYSEDMQKTISRFEDLQEAFGFGEVEFPKALSKHKTKTMFFMEYVDARLDLYKELCMNGSEEEKRRWNILNDMYLKEKRLKAEQISEKYNFTNSRPYKEINKACQTLKILFFGIDGIDGFLE